MYQNKKELAKENKILTSRSALTSETAGSGFFISEDFESFISNVSPAFTVVVKESSGASLPSSLYK